MTRVGHLVRRFFGALRPGGPSSVDTEWVAKVLQPGEFTLWSRMPGHDRRHSIAVARRVERALTESPHAGDSRWLAAALLHDVGKLEAGFGVFARVGATVVGAVAGHERARSWAGGHGVWRRVGLYLRHPEFGAALIREAAGRDEAARWAEVHHRSDPQAESELPGPVVLALCEADDD